MFCCSGSATADQSKTIVPARSGTYFSIAQDPDDPHKLVKVGADGQKTPYYHIGRSAYLLMNPYCPVTEFLDDAAASGADTLRIFLIADWRYVGKWVLNPWQEYPGDHSNGDLPWWQGFDESPGGYWQRLDQLLTEMEHRGMVAEISIFDHFTFARLEHEFPGEAVPFFSRIGSEQDDGRLTALLDRLIRSLQNHGNVIVEVGNQICMAWFRHEIHRGTGTVLDFIPQKNDDLHCALWMKDVADYFRNHFGSSPVPLLTNSSRFNADHFFELTLVDGWNCPVSYHSNRDREWWKWNWNAMIGKPNLNSGLYNRFDLPFVDNEPMKFGDRSMPGLTESDPDRLRYYAWISAMSGVYHTYHSIWGSTTVPDRQLTAAQRAGAAYLPIFSRFVKDPANQFHRLHPSPGLVKSVSPEDVETFSATGKNRDVFAVYLLRKNKPNRTILRFREPMTGYKMFLFDTASGKKRRLTKKNLISDTEVIIPATAWKGSDILFYANRSKSKSM